MSKADENKTNIIFLSSNASQKYITDYLETIAAPNGLIIHYRYQNRWIDEKLFELLNGKDEGISNELKDKEVILCHLLQFQADPNVKLWEWRKIFPLRLAKLKFAFTTSKQSLDGVSHFYFEVYGHLYSDDAVKTMKEFNEKLIKRKIEEKDSQVYAGIIIEELENVKTDSGSEDFFYKSSSQLLEIDIYPSKNENFIYYKPVYLSLGGILNPDSGNPKIEYNPQKRKSCFSLLEGGYYQLCFYVLANVDENRYKIEFNYDEELLVNQDQNCINVNSKYDYNTWDFSPRITKRKTWTSLNVTIKQVKPKDKQKVLDYNFSIPILIKKNNWIRALDTSADVLLPVAGLFLILYKASSANSPWFDYYPWGFGISVFLYVIFRVITRFWNDK